MTYLSCHKTSIENFTCLANNTATMTEEYAQVLKDIEREEFPIKLRTLEITAIALVALGVLIAATTSVIPGIIVGSLAVFPMIGVKYQLDKQNNLLGKLNQKAYDIDVIFQNIIEDLKIYQRHKEAVLIYLFNNLYTPSVIYGDGQEQAIGTLKDYTYQFDTHAISLDVPSDNEKYEEYLERLPLVKSIVDRSSPPTVSSNNWQTLQKACRLFLYGERENSDETYVCLEKGKGRSFSWRAKRY